jgi:hypothetical protein
MPSDKTWQQWLERLYNLRRDLVSLAGRPVMKPSEEKLFPAPESLSWREQHLTTKC